MKSKKAQKKKSAPQPAKADTSCRTEKQDAASPHTVPEEEISAADQAFVLQGGEVSVSSKRRVRRIFAVLGIITGGCAALAILFFGTVLGILVYLSRPVTAELDERVSLGPLTEHPLLSRVCEVRTDVETLDTSNICDLDISLRFFGCIDRTMQVQVRDTIPPELEAVHMSIMQGMKVAPEEFVVRCLDRTPVTFSFAEGTPDLSQAGDLTLTLCAEDAGGNVTQRSVNLHIIDTALAVRTEVGTPLDQLQQQICADYPEFIEPDISSVDVTSPGEYRIRAQSADTHYLLLVIVEDTVPPVFEVKPVNILSGQTLRIEDLVVSSHDSTQLTFRYETEPDLDTCGAHTVTVIAADEGGNTASQTAQIVVYPYLAQGTLECGYGNDQLLSALMTGDGNTEYVPTFDADFNAAALTVGEHEVTLHGLYHDMTVHLTVQDTTPPVLKCREVTVAIGHALKPEDFVAELHDATAVTLSFQKQPSSASAGDYTVNITAADAAGNETHAQTVLHVIPDTVPPVFSGVKDIYASVGDTVSYRSGVSAVDETDGKLKFTVDTSAVNTSVPGTYVITYSATDSSGNTATAKAKVVIRAISMEKLNAQADRVLKSIISNSMSDRAKAEAIFNWCSHNITYSAAANTFMGDYIPAAYAGFTTYRGNCYTYYAVSRALLDRVGIENMEIKRNSTTNPHYWNLVKMDGAWYHFDTCPHPAGHYIRVFLLTDAEVTAYSKNEVKDYYNFDTSAYPPTPVKKYVMKRILWFALILIYPIYALCSLASCTDRAGEDITQAMVDDCAAKVNAEILQDTMSEREKCRAIFDWCSDNLYYSTQNANLTGQFLQAAYSGFMTHRGNCYMYFAVAKSLMDDAGIQNMEIHRESEDNPHYWNLVCLDGNWYHFDTCPHPAYHPLEVFLLTDEEVNAYSRFEVEDYYNFDTSKYPPTP